MERATLHLRFGGESCAVQESRRQIHKFHQDFRPQSFLKSPRPAENQGHPDSFLIEMRSFEQEAVIAQHLAVVGHEDYNRVIPLAGLLQHIQHSPHFVVDVLDHRVIGGDDFAGFVIGHVARRIIARRIMGPDVIELLKTGFARKLAFTVFRQRHLGRVVAVQILPGGSKG